MIKRNAPQELFDELKKIEEKMERLNKTFFTNNYVFYK